MAKPLNPAWTTDITMNSDGSKGQSLQYGHWWQHSPCTSTWLQSVARTIDRYRTLGGNMAIDINTVPGHNRTMDLALSSCIEHGYQHGFRWLHGSFISIWPLTCRMTLGHQYGFRQEH